MTFCLYCGSAERNFASKKFCTDCGNNWTPTQAVDQPADVHRYIDALYQSVQSSDFEDGTDLIKRMRTRFKISHTTHQNIVADLRERLQIVEGLHTFTVEFNQNDSDAYAEQDTLLQFRLINDTQGEQLKYAELSWDDPDSASGRGFKARTSLPVRPGASASLQGSHVFMRFGPKSIDRMQLKVENLLGDVGDFMVEPMVFNVRNPDQKISKNVTNIINQERGVIDNSSSISDADGAALGVGRQAIWKKLVLFPMVQRPDDIEALIGKTNPPQEVRTEPTPAIPTERLPESPTETTRQVTPNQHAEPTHKELAQETTAPTVATASHAGQTSPAEKTSSPTSSSPTLAGSSPSIGSDDPRECANQVFKRLTWFAQASPINKPHTSISSDRFDLDFLDVIYHCVPDANEDDVLGMIFVDGGESVVFDQYDCVINFDTLACVFSVSGVTLVSVTDNTVNAESFHSWGEMASMGWSFYRRRFGDDKFVVSFGDGGVSQNLPGCKFDLRQYKGDTSVTSVFEEANAWLQRLFELAPPAPSNDEDVGQSIPHEAAEEGDSAQWSLEPEPVNASAVSLASAENTPVVEEFEHADEEDEDEARLQTLDEIGSRMQRFFSKLDFAMQRCDEHQAHCIFTQDRVDDELLQALHDSVYNTGSGMRVVCVDPGCALTNENGLLVGFKGTASALSAEGIFHMATNPTGGYVMDGSNSFLGWQRFFEEFHADLIVREEGPDLWLGTPMNYLIRGCYVDYSVQVIQWDYLENYVLNDLRHELHHFKDAIDWL